MQVLGGRGCTTAAIAAAFTTVLVHEVNFERLDVAHYFKDNPFINEVLDAIFPAADDINYDFNVRLHLDVLRNVATLLQHLFLNRDCCGKVIFF